MGRVDYVPTWDAMRAFTESRTAETADVLWGVEHAPVFTLGQAGKPEHLLAPHDVAVVHTDRGGQVTYHGPGQAVVYLLLDIRRRRWMVRETVERIEEAVIRTLARWGIEGERKPGAPGIYLGASAVSAPRPVAARQAPRGGEKHLGRPGVFLSRKRRAAPSFLDPHGGRVGEPTLGALRRRQCQ